MGFKLKPNFIFNMEQENDSKNEWWVILYVILIIGLTILSIYEINQAIQLYREIKESGGTCNLRGCSSQKETCFIGGQEINCSEVDKLIIP